MSFFSPSFVSFGSCRPLFSASPRPFGLMIDDLRLMIVGWGGPQAAIKKALLLSAGLDIINKSS
jgi:hypothetical protein